MDNLKTSDDLTDSSVNKPRPVPALNLTNLQSDSTIENTKSHIVNMFLAGDLLSRFLPDDEHVIEGIRLKLNKLSTFSSDKLISFSEDLDEVILSFSAKMNQIPPDEILSKAARLKNSLLSKEEQKSGRSNTPRMVEEISVKQFGTKQEVSIHTESLGQMIEEEQAKALPVLFTLTRYFGNNEDQFVAWNLNEESIKVNKYPLHKRVEPYSDLRYKQTAQELKLLTNFDNSIWLLRKSYGDLCNLAGKDELENPEKEESIEKIFREMRRKTEILTKQNCPNISILNDENRERSCEEKFTQFPELNIDFSSKSEIEFESPIQDQENRPEIPLEEEKSKIFESDIKAKPPRAPSHPEKDSSPIKENNENKELKDKSSESSISDLDSPFSESQDFSEKELKLSILESGDESDSKRKIKTNIMKVTLKRVKSLRLPLSGKKIDEKSKLSMIPDILQANNQKPVPSSEKGSGISEEVKQTVKKKSTLPPKPKIRSAPGTPQRKRVPKWNNPQAEKILANLFKNIDLNLNSAKDKAFQLWKFSRPQKSTIPFAIVDDYSPTKSISTPINAGMMRFSIQLSSKDFNLISEECKAQARQSILEEKMKMLKNNLIMDQYSKVETKTAKLMNYSNIFTFLEEMMDSKYKTDLRDLKDKRKPRSMTEFLMEFLNRRFGIENLAMKTLSQILPTLKNLVDENHPYACFFARLLQIFHPDPVPYNLSLYLVRARMEFHPLIEKADKLKETIGFNLSKEAQQKNTTHGRAQFDYAGTGGEAMVIDVIKHAYLLFEEDPESGTLFFEKICPERVNFNDFIAFLISNKMRKKGKRPEELFHKLDKERTNSISAQIFIDGAKNDLELWISNENIQNFFQQLDSSGNGEVDLNEFTAVINIDKYTKCTTHLDYIVTKEKFLNALIDVYEFRQIRDGAFLRQTLMQNSLVLMDFETFAETIKLIDNEVSQRKIEDLHSEALSVSVEPHIGVDSDAFVKIALRHGIGNYGLGSFAIRELLDALRERQFVVDIALDKGEPVTVRKADGSDVKRSLVRSRSVSNISKEKDQTPTSKGSSNIPRFMRKNSNKNTLV
ncbi:unnamed protein product [Blepharisma stoltei]|uniref:EF-hand domain-containing protein n=1 Tax=Blepharisma stoltei TaxID=1481888 RepID=A0AAU9JB42_9CILI|nr:unnamed protein product [Blepharisma stoltei]